MSTYFASDKNFEFKIPSLELPVFVNQYLRYLMIEQNRAPRTIFNYGVSCRTFLRWVRYLQMHNTGVEFDKISVADMKLDEIAHFTRIDIYDYLAFCATELKNEEASRAAKLAALKSMYEYLRKIGAPEQIQVNPAQDISPPKLTKKLPKWLSLDECHRLLAAVDPQREARDYCIILWFLSCGMRESELANIDVKDIKGNLLKVTGKGRKERVLYLNQSCMDALENYLIERNHVQDKLIDKDALFISPRTMKRLTATAIYNLVYKALKKAGLEGEGYSVHKLRHSAASLLHQNGTDVLEISEILGHASVKTTQVYCHTTGELVKTALESMNILTNMETK